MAATGAGSIADGSAESLPQDATRRREVLDRAYRSLAAAFDPQNGGFGSAPKFPSPHQLSFLLRYGQRTADAHAHTMVRRTLDAMAAGGIRDHLAGGFHRYATDAAWHVPHFEKMLYDQAGLAMAYTDAYLALGDEFYARIAREICNYVLQGMTDPHGGFYSAEDADSQGEEGRFYVWTLGQIRTALELGNGTDSRTIADAFAQAYGVLPEGNWEGRNILLRDDPRAPLSADLERAGRRLREAREQRVRPARDEKIIVAWNGFMIEALARTGRALGEPRFVQAASRAADSLEAHLWRDGRLLRYARDGAADLWGYLDDYAYLGAARLALYEATGDWRHADRAAVIAEKMLADYELPGGGFALRNPADEELIAPVVEWHDGAMPAGNSIAALFLMRLGHLLTRFDWEEAGRRALRAAQAKLGTAPQNYAALLAALDFAAGPVREIVIVGDPNDPRTRALERTVAEAYLPNAISARSPGAGAPATESGPFATPPPDYLRTQAALQGRPTAYVCIDYACLRPLHDPQALAATLQDPRPQL